MPLLTSGRLYALVGNDAAFIQNVPNDPGCVRCSRPATVEGDVGHDHSSGTGVAGLSEERYVNFATGRWDIMAYNPVHVRNKNPPKSVYLTERRTQQESDPPNRKRGRLETIGSEFERTIDSGDPFESLTRSTKRLWRGLID